MEDWKKKYEEYKSTSIETKYSEYCQEIEKMLAGEKIQEGQANQLKAKELKKMKRIYGYLPQVENLKEAIVILKNRVNAIRGEMNARQKLMKAQSNAAKEDIEIAALEAEIEKESASLVGKEDTEFERLQALQDKQIKLNDLKMKATSRTMPEISHDSELADLSWQELKMEMSAARQQIARCNLAASCFMEGYSKENIDLKVNKEWKNRRLTSKEPITSKKELKAEHSSELTTEEDKLSANMQKTSVIDKGMISAVDAVRSDEKAILDINRIKEQIQKAHPILSKLSKLPFGLGKGAESRLERYVEQEKERLEKLNETEKEVKTIAEKDFKAKYAVANWNVMDIAEKGISEIEAEQKAKEQAEKEAQKAKRKAELKAKREEYRKAAYDREKENFGEPYAEQSYKVNDDGDER